jgi:hypothetical protein
MTVRLLVPAYGKQTNALYTGSAATERALIDAGQADNQLDASFDYQAFLAGKSMAPPNAGLTSSTIDYAGGDPTARARVRSTPVRVVTFGHSTADTGVIMSPASQDMQALTASNWQSGLVTLTMPTNKWALPEYYPQAYLVANCGISGNTTGAMLARDAAGASVTRKAIRDALDFSPDVVIYRGLSINNFVAVASDASVATAVSAAQADVIEIMTRFATSGVPVIVTGEYGYGGAVDSPYPGDPAFIRKALAIMNVFAKGLVSQFPNCRYADPVGIIADASALPLSASYFGDGVHLNSIGANLMAAAEAAALTALFGPSSNVRYRGLNMVSDPLLIASTGQASGQIANGYSLITTNFTRSGNSSKIESITSQGRTVRMQTSSGLATAANASSGFTLPFDPTAAGFNPALGDIFGVEFDLYIAPVAAPLAAISELVRVDIRDSVGSGRVLLERGGVYNYSLDRPLLRHIVMPPVKFGDGAANLTAASGITVAVNGIGLGEQLKVGVGGLRIVKL